MKNMPGIKGLEGIPDIKPQGGDPLNTSIR